MIIYNVTTHVDHSVHDAWLKWMQEEHIPEVLNTGCFTNHQLVKLLETDETEGITYAVQYYADSKAAYNRYTSIYAARLRQAVADKWGDKTVGFRSLMQVVH
ncbi:DUF4286 family protein [Panacibacter sp. DH6]|uniref:DUF4286 family protein n=1 Tax=Panacibacter microcysteis TaxID=2793269 RepID=A0A931GYC2_9BACT|nr:DUF4286 family protein [Panacibacter microcysteis]MBG9375237.1 DUF4286 family protein [Panacibacter microcysteis]